MGWSGDKLRLRRVCQQICQVLGLAVCEDFLNRVQSVGGEFRVGISVVWDVAYAGQRPAASSRPRCVIDRERGAEHDAALASEERPRGHEVECGIAHVHTAEVDHSAQTASGDQNIPGQQVAVDPHGRTIASGRPERRIPRRGHQVGVDHAVRRCDRSAYVGISLC